MAAIREQEHWRPGTWSCWSERAGACWPGDTSYHSGHGILEVLEGQRVGEGEADLGKFPGQVGGVRLRPRSDFPVPSDISPVPVILPVLSEQDQRSGVGSLRGNTRLSKMNG